MIFYILGFFIYIVPGLWVNYTLNKHDDALPNMPFTAKEFKKSKFMYEKHTKDFFGSKNINVINGNDIEMFQKELLQQVLGKR